MRSTYSNYTALGTLVDVQTPSFNTDKKVLQVTMRVPTGERKPDGEKYAPSNFVRFLAWEKDAESFEGLEKGTKLFVSGTIKQLRPYSTDSGPKCSIELDYPRVVRVEYPENKTTREATSESPTNPLPDKPAWF